MVLHVIKYMVNSAIIMIVQITYTYLCSWQQKPEHEYNLYFIIEGKPEAKNNIRFNITYSLYLGCANSECLTAKIYWIGYQKVQDLPKCKQKISKEF